MTHTSTCTCGQVRFTSQADPYRVSICHCLECQLRTGSVFGVQARFKRGETRVEGPVTRYVREVPEDGDRITFHFCPRCGSTVYWYLDSDPEMVATAVGNFANPDFPAPTVAVFEHRRHKWVELSGLDIKHFNEIFQ